ncbi:MAG: 4Fe-4S binding protein [Candidatus Firestonebacteria bacterium]|nr:4Fe-4S binding protein [Candidatus Firestonebacteria bacterium]
MAEVRKIIKIDEDRCNGCGQCIPNCPEGALQVIDGKARLVSDFFCDGLGACLGHCPKGAISVEERAAEPYSEERVMENIVAKGENTTRAHLEHLHAHGETELFNQAVAFLKTRRLPNPYAPALAELEHHGGCPGTRIRAFKPEASSEKQNRAAATFESRESQLQNWPVQIHLLNPNAPYFKDADLLIAADCTAFSLADFHETFLKGKVLLIGCPKLDDGEAYGDKLTAIFKNNKIRSITLLHMEVPCCFGLLALVKEALAQAQKQVPLESVEVSLQGQIKTREAQKN